MTPGIGSFPEDMEIKRYIKSVYQFQNGVVMCFDQFGQQMPEYQGDDAIEKIRASGFTGEIEQRIFR